MKNIIIDKKVRSKQNEDIADLTNKNEDWKYSPLQSDINNLELGKNTDLEVTEGFDVNTNWTTFNINNQIEGLTFTDLTEIQTPVIDESIKRPIDKFLFQQLTKATGGFRIDVNDDVTEYCKVNFESKENTIPYIGVNVNKNKTAKFCYSIHEFFSKLNIGE